MKKLSIALSVIFLLMLGTDAFSQKDKSKRPSPPAQASADIDGVSVTIDYSQPSLKNREFGTKKFHPYGKIWRNGANEATWIEVSDDVKINGENLPKGKYSFFVIPNENEWTLVFNSTWEQWGAYDYDDSKDVLRVNAKSTKSTPTEKYTIELADNGEGSLNWADFSVSFLVSK
ncbi:MAG: DUF2911 domain-containing protein [Cyclobacteriaceae bacterium]